MATLTTRTSTPFRVFAKKLTRLVFTAQNFVIMLLLPLLIVFFYSFNQSSTTEPVLYDLTYPVNNITLDWSGETFQLNVTSEQVNEGNISYWYQLDTISTPTHLGTHLDAPCHFGKGQWCVSDIPIDRLYQRPGYVIDITEKVDKDRNYMLSEEDLVSWINSVGTIEHGAVLLIKTNISQHWPNRIHYFGLTSSGSMNFPGMSPEAAKAIISRQLNIYGLGIEGASVDNGPSKDYSVHTILAAANVYNLENIGPLIAKLPDKNFKLTSLPIKIDGASGSPVRVIAHVYNNSYSKSTSFTFKMALVMIIPFVIFTIY